jgi:hypothetical protein
MSAIQNPKIQQLMQMNPQAQAIMAAAMAHINEHIAFEYRKQIEMQIGVPLPGEEQNKHMPPELADQIAMATAKHHNSCYNAINNKHSSNRTSNRCKTRSFRCSSKSCS